MPGSFVRSSCTTSTNKYPLFQTSRTREAMANQLAMKKTQLGLLKGFRSSSSRLSQLLSLGAWWRRSTGKGGILCQIRINPNICQNILILSFVYRDTKSEQRFEDFSRRGSQCRSQKSRNPRMSKRWNFRHVFKKCLYNVVLRIRLLKLEKFSHNITILT